MRGYTEKARGLCWGSSRAGPARVVDARNGGGREMQEMGGLVLVACAVVDVAAGGGPSQLGGAPKQGTAVGRPST